MSYSFFDLSTPVRRPGSVSVDVSYSAKILSPVADLGDFFGFDFQSDTCFHSCMARLFNQGWNCLDRSFDAVDVTDLRLDYIKRKTAGRYTIISPEGDVFIASFFADSVAELVQIRFNSVGIRIKGYEDAPLRLRALHWARCLVSDEATRDETIPEVRTRLDRDQATFYIGNTNGELAIISSPAGLGDDFTRVEDIGFGLAEYADEIASPSHAAYKIDHPVLGDSFVSVERHIFGFNKTNVMTLRLQSAAQIVTAEKVLTLFPHFSQMEALAVATMSQGNSIQQSASLLGKSHVTVALQIRSALGKSDINTIEKLITATCLRLK